MTLDPSRRHVPLWPCGSILIVHAVEIVFGVGWAAFWIYWLVAAFSMKRGNLGFGRGMRFRIPMIVVIFILFRSGAVRSQSLNTNAALAAIGLVLFVLGLAFAIWARVNIGRNWGMPMSKKDAPELVTSGPYRLVRHPIYTGILVAGVGTGVALTWVWFYAVVLAGAYFIYSATVEERYMTTEFPDTYPAYKRTTKMLIPFIF